MRATIRLPTALAAAILALTASACTYAPATFDARSRAIDSPRFSERALPEGPDYATTIRYIDTRVRYEDIDARFVIGPAGDMCYSHGLDNYWCISPKQVGSVRMDRYVELHCSKWFPYCAYQSGPARGWNAPEYSNRIQIREQFEDRTRLVRAFHHLIGLMGGREEPRDLAKATGTAVFR